jgi:hypothetical protein
VFFQHIRAEAYDPISLFVVTLQRHRKFGSGARSTVLGSPPGITAVLPSAACAPAYPMHSLFVTSVVVLLFCVSPLCTLLVCLYLLIYL